MVHQILIESGKAFLCAIGFAVAALSTASATEEPMDLSSVSTRELIEMTVDGASEAQNKSTDQQSNGLLELPTQHSQLESFVKECAELNAVPLLDLSEQDDKKVFLGINFDGFLGVYAHQ